MLAIGNKKNKNTVTEMKNAFVGFIKVNWSESYSVVSNSLRPWDYTVHGFLQARILEWVAFPFSSGSSQPRNQTRVSCIAGGFFTNWTVREAFIAVTKTRIKNGSTGDFCGGPVGKTVHFQCWGPGFEPWLGN